MEDPLDALMEAERADAVFGTTSQRTMELLYYALQATNPPQPVFAAPLRD